ncbi:hypothetical protein EYC84_011107 [Monilinia fructicola]|uniref:Core domain-containing protein n=1 Tax=Monilinia fructicola TaxID=38448 RepID=A0A5M9JC11_MONFR|nr:hypothetical protein EYC84_011107 [Monilinia fructicola]
MSLQRAVAPLTSSAPIIFRFASSQSSTPLRECRHSFVTSLLLESQVLRRNARCRPVPGKTYTLSTPPPPPPPARAAAIPESPITGGIPQVHDTRPPSVNFAETEAQKKTISLTPRAVEALRELSNQPEAKLIKISVAARGCSGSAYDLKYVEKGALSDIVHEQDGVKVLIDPAAQLKIIVVLWIG